MDNFLDSGIEGTDNMSQTLKHLLENPALLQPPAGETKENKKEGKLKCKDQDGDYYPSAYLGPQIWEDMLLSVDLKLEPVNLDELLNISTDNECDNFNLLLDNNKGSPPATNDAVEAPLQYQDMPALMSTPSPQAKQTSPLFPSLTQPIVTPSSQDMTLLSAHMQEPHVQSLDISKGFTQFSSPMIQQQESRKVFCQEQAAVMADILSTNKRYDSTPLQQDNNHMAMGYGSNNKTQFDALPNLSGHQQNQKASSQVGDCGFLISSGSTGKASNIAEAENSSGPIQVRIPSPVKVDFEVNKADLVISTPADLSGESNHFDPSSRSFSREELKPQPIIRKSHKIFVPAEEKDDKYWSRRNKNNAAAKRSREARRIKENQISLRASYLEQENLSLKTEVKKLREELQRIMVHLKESDGFELRVNLNPTNTMHP